MAAAELAIDPSAQPAGRPERAPWQAEERPRLELVPPHRSWARPAAGFVYDGAPACRLLRAGLSRRPAACAPLPMEDVILFAKPIDNSQVRRPTDPRDRRLMRAAALYGFLALLLTAATFGPRAWLRDTEARLAETRLKTERMTEYRDQLRLRLAQYADPRRVAAMAEANGFVRPGLDRYFWHNPSPPEEALAGASIADADDGDFVSRP